MLRTAGGAILMLAIIAAGFLLARDYVRRHPQDFPWTKLDLAHPAGAFTAGKIARLGDKPRVCRALIAAAGLEDQPAPGRSEPPDCGYRDGVRIGGRTAAYLPGALVTSCPVAAALHLFETRVVQPAAQRHFGTPVTAIHHAGSYSCRRLYGRSEGRFSEHSTADAIDITGFQMGDGRRVSVQSGWGNAAPEGAFLTDVRDGACRLFPTVLSPDYNAAHGDHLHLDVAVRGTMSWTMCR